MKRVYIAGPYSGGDIAMNVRQAVEAADMVLDLGHAPHVPHLYHLWHLISPHPKEEWLKLDRQWLMMCDVVWRLPGESAGADMEVELSKYAGLPTVYSIEALKHWLASLT